MAEEEPYAGPSQVFECRAHAPGTGVGVVVRVESPNYVEPGKLLALAAEALYEAGALVDAAAPESGVYRLSCREFDRADVARAFAESGS